MIGVGAVLWLGHGIKKVRTWDELGQYYGWAEAITGEELGKLLFLSIRKYFIRTCRSKKRCPKTKKVVDTLSVAIPIPFQASEHKNIMF